MKAFRNKLVLITGGSSGIGFALAKNLAARGAHVFILARRKQLLEDALIEIEAYRQSPEQRFGVLPVDISNENWVNDVLDQFVAESGVPDLLINNAGVAYAGKFEDTPIEIFHQMMNVNYFGMVNVLKNLVPHMIQKKSGHIVNLSSIAGFGGVYGYTAYGASKYAISGLSETLLIELKYSGIKVSVVFPADTETPQLEEDRRMRPAVSEALSSGVGGVMTAEKTAEMIVKGIQKEQYVITPGSQSSSLYTLRHSLGTLSIKIIQMLTDQAVKKVESSRTK